ncbi:Formyl-coenzyme A transferase [Oceanibacterium hippocampi]|uniref:Formyl-coenzyme A transferase n=1 Tax=Oceanibacterium hippocampi TaxID=745714 RepID=A0A1Y5SUH4_9PROT|nr:CaiB/BaiF CoA-transferase family protein [Oceanibacterium hippocampi]SLN47230.1 Formyl-coenzyme A transferase [Oceanibacterium hippocampi]
MHALDGIKVLDLSRVLAGPWCAQTLADLGADVWKVEAPGTGDDTRTWMPPEIGGESTYYLCANRSKRSIAVDFRTAAGQEIVRRFAREADVVVENFRHGALERYGLDHASLAALNPRLIYCSISGYGRTGSRATEPGYDFAIQAESGLMSITGDPDGEPMKLGVAIADVATGMNAVQAILAALFARERSGEGQFIDMSLLDSAVSLLANVASGHLATGGAPGRFGNAHATVAPYQIFPSADGSFALAVGNDRQFAILCGKVIGRPELAEDPRFLTNRKRVDNREALIPILREHFMTRPTAHWIAALKAAGVPSGQVRTVPEVFAAPEIAERGLTAEVADKRHGTLRLMRSPLQLRGTPTRAPSAPPRLGEHTDELLREVLGASADEIAEWRRNGAVA